MSTVCWEPALVASVVSALAGEGQRVLVTASEPDTLGRVRSAFPPGVRELCRSGPDPLTRAEHRELRRLLTDGGRVEPAPRRVEAPEPSLVAELCRAAARPTEPPRTTAELIPDLLVALPADRRTGLIEIAARCVRALEELDGADTAEDGRVDGEPPLSWLLTMLVFGGDRVIFERLGAGLREVAASAARRPGRASPALVGGRPDGRGGPVDPASFAADCTALGLRTPVDRAGAGRLSRRLDLVAEAVPAVDALRHQVLFIHPESPIAVPDLATVREVAWLIVAAPVTEEMVAARRRLAELADGLAGELTDGCRLPGPAERAAIQALRECRLPDYLAALRDMDTADRSRRRCDELLDRLAAAEPGAAHALRMAAGRDAAVPGAVWLTPVEDLVVEPDRARRPDVVVSLGSLAAAGVALEAVGRRVVVFGPDGLTAAPVAAGSAAPDRPAGPVDPPASADAEGPGDAAAPDASDPAAPVDAADPAIAAVSAAPADPLDAAEPVDEPVVAVPVDTVPVDAVPVVRPPARLLAATRGVARIPSVTVPRAAVIMAALMASAVAATLVLTAAVYSRWPVADAVWPVAGLLGVALAVLPGVRVASRRLIGWSSSRRFRAGSLVTRSRDRIEGGGHATRSTACDVTDLAQIETHT